MTTIIKAFSIPNYVRSTFTDPDGLHVYTSSNGMRKLSVSDSKSIIRNPNWQKEVLSGANATTPYTKTVQRYSPPVTYGTSSGYQDVAKKRSFTARVDAVWTPYDPSLYILREVASADAIALQRLKAKLRTQAGMVNAAVPLVELRELRGTVKGIANASLKLLYDLVQLKKRVGRGGYKAVQRDAAELWLNFGFGVSPTIRDANSIISAIQRRLDQPVAIRTSAIGKETRHIGAKVANGILYGCTSWHTLDGEQTVSYRYTAGTRLSVTAGNSYKVYDDFGLNFKALPLIGWELIPFSWVVDYFVPIGSYFDETFSGSVPLKYVSRSKKCTTSLKLTNTFEPVAGFANACTGFGQGKYEFFEFTRTKPSLELPPATLHFKTVDQVGKNAVNKVLNLASVLIATRRS